MRDAYEKNRPGLDDGGRIWDRTRSTAEPTHTIGFMKRLFPFACVALLVGCASANPTPGPQPRAVVAEYEPYLMGGTAVLEGSAVIPVRNGEVWMEGMRRNAGGGEELKTAAGRLVTLDPATPSAIAWLRERGLKHERFADMPNDTLFRLARRTTTAGEGGTFRFAGLAPGRYIVRTTITWEVPKSGYHNETRGGVVAAVVTVDPSPVKTVRLIGIATPAMFASP